MNEILNGRNPRGDRRLMDARERVDDYEALPENGQPSSDGHGKTTLHNVEEVTIARWRKMHLQGKVAPQR
ncbi:MAG: hypothetical protein ACR2GY_01720 [Phycisphaerales bacterium]